MLTPPGLQRFNASGRIESVPAPAPDVALPPPVALAEAPGYTMEQMAGGMVRLRGPRGESCGVFANAALVPATLGMLRPTF